MVLALGASLKINGRFYPIPLPFRLIQDTFIAVVIRQPIRFNIILSIPMAMLAAWGVVGLYHAITRRFWAHIIVVVACLLILFEYAMPYPTLALEIPDWYQTVVAPNSDEFAILGIPMDPRQDPDKLYMFYQTEHNKPLVEGHVSRISREARAFIDTLSFPNTVGIGAQMELLNKANVRYIVLHKQLAWSGEIVTWRRRLMREPDYEDDEVVVYEIPRFLQVDDVAQQPLTAELGLMQQATYPETVLRGGSLPITLDWGSRLPIAQDYNVCFDLLDTDGNSVQTYCAPVADCLPTSSWHTPEMIRSNYVFQLDDVVAEGDYQLVLSLQEAGVDSVIVSALLGDVTVAVTSDDVARELETAVWGDSQIEPARL